jgi:hypothetical protein
VVFQLVFDPTSTAVNIRWIGGDPRKSTFWLSAIGIANLIYDAPSRPPDIDLEKTALEQ